MKEAVRERENKRWLEKSENKPWAEHFKPPTKQTKQAAACNKLPRAVAVANFRLNTGHDLLGAHLHTLGIIGSNICNLCKLGILDRAHLFSCAELQNEIDLLPPNMTRVEKESHLYWLARRVAFPAS